MVNLSYFEETPPRALYHGTSIRFHESIRQQGLNPGQRHYVHLSQDEATARDVGSRYGTPVELTIHAAKMHMRGHRIFQADNGVCLTKAVPAEFLGDVY